MCIEKTFTKECSYGKMSLVILVLFERKQQELNKIEIEKLEQIEYKNKFGFIEQLKSSVRTDEEYAKFKGYID